MNIAHCRDYQEMSHRAASLVLEEITRKPGLLLCAPTGASPEGLFQELVSTASTDPGIFDQIRIIKLDEWGGIPAYHPASCEYFLSISPIPPMPRRT